MNLLHRSQIRAVASFNDFVNSESCGYYKTFNETRYIYCDRLEIKHNVNYYSDKKKGKVQKETKAVNIEDSEIYKFSNVFCRGVGSINKGQDYIFTDHLIENEGLYSDFDRFKELKLIKIQDRLKVNFNGLGQCSLLPNDKIVSLIDGPVFLLSRSRDDAYSHFVWDTLPLLFYFFQLKEKISNLKLLIPSCQESQFPSYKLEYLSALGVSSDDLIFKNIDEVFFCRNIYVGRSISTNNQWIKPAGLDVLKGLRLQSLPKSKKPVIVYLDRNDERAGIRSLDNEEKIKDICKRYGAEIFTPGKMSLKEKQELFVRADIVVGQYGGGMQHQFLCKEKCRFILLQSPNFFRYIHYFTSGFLKQATFSIVGVSKGTYNNANYIVDSAVFEDTLKRNIQLCG